MRLTKLLLLIIPFIYMCKGIENNRNLISMIRDFVTYQKLPTKVFSFLCFKKNDNLDLSKELSKLNVQNAVLKVNETKIQDDFAQYQLFLIDLSCNGYWQLFEAAQKSSLFQNPYRWFTFNGDVNLKLPNECSILVDSNFFVATKTSEDTYSLKAIFKYTPTDLNFNSNDVAIWMYPKGFTYFCDLVPPSNRSNLMGTNIKISYVVTNLDTLNHLWDYRERHVDSITKVNYILVNHLMDIANASKEFIIQRSWGYQNKTTKLYDGMIGDLQRGLADIGGTPSFFTDDRVLIIDYIAATTPTHMKFIFKAPPLSYVTNVFTLPFDTLVWYSSYVMVAIIFVILYVIVFWEWKDPKFRSKLEYLENTSMNAPLRANVLDVLMLEIGALTQQGSDVEPKSLSGRITTIFTFTILMFMYTSYSANIVALLQSTTDSFKTLDDLLHSRIKLGVEDIVYAHYYFSIADEPVRKAIYEQKVAPKGQPSNFMTAQKGITKMREDFFAFHIELSTGYKIVSDTFQEDEKCNLKEIEFIRLIEPWISTQKHSSFKEIMKVGMRKLHHSGIQNREVFRVYTKKPVCLSKGNNFVSVGLIDCYFPFLLFGIGITSAILILLIELALHRYFLNKQKQLCVHTKEINVSEYDLDKNNYLDYID